MSAGRRSLTIAGTASGAAVLLVIVAIGISPGISAGHSRLDPAAASAAFSVIFTLVGIGLLALAWVVFWHMFSGGRGKPAGGYSGREFLVSVTAVVVLVGAMIGVVLLLPRRSRPPTAAGGVARMPNNSSALHHGPSIAYNWAYGLSTMLAVAAVLFVVLLVGHVGRRRRRRNAPPSVLDDLLGAQVIAEAELVTSLASVAVPDPASEPDARRAIISAWLAMTDVLGRLARPRRPSEAPQEYLHSVLVSAGAGTASAGVLTSLFEEARFSHHEIGEDKRRQAMWALENVRNDLGLGTRVTGS